MNCTEHPDKVVNSHCDVCHKPFCPSCLQDDRGRFVCKRCFDPANQPGELAGNNPNLPVVPDEKSIARKAAIKAFWDSPTGAGLQRAGTGLFTAMCVYGIFLCIAEKDYWGVVPFALWILLVYGPLFSKSRIE